MSDRQGAIRTGDTPGHGQGRAFFTGPEGRGTELRHAMRVVREFIHDFRVLHFVGPCVTVIGSGQPGEGDPDYELARAVGHAMAKAGLTVITTGGAGVMEAASRGAREAGGRTVACTLEEPGEDRASPAVDRELPHRYLFVRDAMLVKYSVGLVVLPGGFATMKGLFDAMTLSRSGDLCDFPVVLMGARHWRPIVNQIGASMAGSHELSDAVDLGRVVITDSPEDATRSILRSAAHRLGGKPAPRPARRTLGERSLDGLGGLRRRRHRSGWRWLRPRSVDRNRP